MNRFEDRGGGVHSAFVKGCELGFRLNQSLMLQTQWTWYLVAIYNEVNAFE